MDFTLIDYSELYFSDMCGGAVPEKRAGKFIQVFNHETGMEYLIMSPAELSVFHANIAERFLSGHGIRGIYNAKKDHYQINNLEWEIKGGGMWTLDTTEKTLSFYGRSQAYGYFWAAGLKEKIVAAHMFPGLNISVNGN